MRDSKDSVKHIHLHERGIRYDANGIARAKSSAVQELIRALRTPSSTRRSHEEPEKIEDHGLRIIDAGKVPRLGAHSL